MIKYYNDKAIAAVVKSVGNKMVLKTWYNVKSNQMRKGILVKM